MENKNIIQQELMETAPALASISRQMPYALPEGYFDELPLTILREVMPKKAKLSVPEGYFESLPELLLQRAKASSVATESALEEAFPLLESIGRNMPYHIPAGYFENWAVPLPKRETPVIPISRPAMAGWRKVAGWAVAASILALVSLFGYRYFSGNVDRSGQIVQNGDEIDSADAVQLADALSKLDDAHLDDALNGYGYNVDQNASYYLNTANFEQVLKNLSDEEIKRNLEEVGYYHKKS